jgi:hypothetical protein
MTRIVRGGKLVDMEEQISRAISQCESNPKLLDRGNAYLTLLKNHCKDSGPSKLVTQYLASLRALHDEGHPQACKWALELACAVDLPARAVDWLFSRKKAHTGRHARYKEVCKDQLWDMLIYLRVSRLTETCCKYCHCASLVVDVKGKWKCSNPQCGRERCIMSIRDACEVLAESKKGKAPESGLEKAYYRHMKRINPEKASPRTWWTERELGWGK